MGVQRVWGIGKLNQKIVIMDCSIKTVIFEWLISYIRGKLNLTKNSRKKKIDRGIDPRETVNTYPQTFLS